jgi:soluble lytic murein transglycosylase-like protein
LRFRFKLGGLFAFLALALFAHAGEIAVLHNGFTIPCQRRQQMGDMTRLYPQADSSSFVDVPTADIDHFEKDLTPPPVPLPAPSAKPASASALKPLAPKTAAELSEIVNSASDRHAIDPDLINSVIHAESGFNARAVSPKGARGLMQLMPQTASDLGVSNSFDPGENIEGGTRYLRELLERYHFDVVKALAAYNAGPQRVEQYRGVPPYYETRVYVARIIRDYNRKKLAEQKAENAAKRAAAKKKPVKATPAKAPADAAQAAPPKPLSTLQATR